MQRLQLSATVMLIGAVVVAVANTGYAGLVYSDPSGGWNAFGVPPNTDGRA